MWFRYPREFFQKYKDVPKFAVVHQGLYSHDDINLIEVIIKGTRGKDPFRYKMSTSRNNWPFGKRRNCWRRRC